MQQYAYKINGDCYEFPSDSNNISIINCYKNSTSTRVLQVCADLQRLRLASHFI